jgi:glycosyl transferase/beta-hydroxylase protein BlmF
MISLLLPTRKRPDNLKRFYESAMEMADKPTSIEVIVYVDDDDDNYNFSLPRLRYIRGPRIVLSEMWNKCYELAVGPIYGHMGDDIIFRNKGWDSQVKNAINQYEDKIVFVHGDDLSNVHGPNFGTHGFIHKNWTDTVGYFVPPYFSSDYNDTWLNDIANAIGRRTYIPELKTEHMHYIFGKSEKDITHEERLARGENDKVDEIYSERWEERMLDAEKLRRLLKW